ncbi:copper resistance CopC family protein [Microbacterium paludicola]|nr:copper resistance CopC family protein [Microbacterium paludicola]MBF0816048.1 copper resistance protein CopC [Microbacterium paludicola]
MTVHRHTRLGALTGLIVAATLALLPAQAASAHDNLLEASPAPGATVAALDTVTLTFSAELIDFGRASYAQVQGPDGLYYETSCSTIDLNVLTTPVALGEAGTYTIDWNAVSSDGHPISESYEFTYAPAEGVEPALGWDEPACRNDDTRMQPGAAPEPTEQPESTANASAPQPSTTETTETENDSGGPVAAAVIGAGALVAAAFVGGLFALRARSRRR